MNLPRGANDTNPAPEPFKRPPSPPEQHRALERVRGVRLWQQGDEGGEVPSRSALDLHLQAVCGRVGRIQRGGGARGGEAGYRNVLLVNAGGPGIASPLILSISRRTCCCNRLAASLGEYPLILIASGISLVSGFASQSTKKRAW